MTYLIAVLVFVGFLLLGLSLYEWPTPRPKGPTGPAESTFDRKGPTGPA